MDFPIITLNSSINYTLSIAERYSTERWIAESLLEGNFFSDPALQRASHYLEQSISTTGVIETIKRESP